MTDRYTGVEFEDLEAVVEQVVQRVEVLRTSEFVGAYGYDAYQRIGTIARDFVRTLVSDGWALQLFEGEPLPPDRMDQAYRILSDRIAIALGRIISSYTAEYRRLETETVGLQADVNRYRLAGLPHFEIMRASRQAEFRLRRIGEEKERIDQLLSVQIAELESALRASICPLWPFC